MITFPICEALVFLIFHGLTSKIRSLVQIYFGQKHSYQIGQSQNYSRFLNPPISRKDGTILITPAITKSVKRKGLTVRMTIFRETKANSPKATIAFPHFGREANTMKRFIANTITIIKIMEYLTVNPHDKSFFELKNNVAILQSAS